MQNAFQSRESQAEETVRCIEAGAERQVLQQASSSRQVAENGRSEE